MNGSADLRECPEEEQVSEEAMIPLLLQNKPPVELETDGLPDLHLRPESVSCLHSLSRIFNLCVRNFILRITISLTFFV